MRDLTDDEIGNINHGWCHFLSKPREKTPNNGCQYWAGVVRRSQIATYNEDSKHQENHWSMPEKRCSHTAFQPVK